MIDLPFKKFARDAIVVVVSTLIAVAVTLSTTRHAISTAPHPVGASYPNVPPPGATGTILTSTGPTTESSWQAPAGVDAGGITLAGDVTGAANANTVASISGSSPIAITPATLQWGQGVASPSLTQATRGSDLATQPLLIQPQAPFASASSNKSPGNVVINEPNSVSSGVHGMVTIEDSGNFQIGMGSYAGVASGTTSFAGIWMGPALAPGTSNYTVLSSGALTAVNVPSGGTLDLDVAGVTVEGITSTMVSMVQPVGGTSGTNAFTWCETTQALTTGTTTLANTVYNCPHIAFTGSLTGANTVVFPTTIGACWDLDLTKITFNSDTVTLQANSNNWATGITSTNGNTNIFHVCVSDGTTIGGHRLYGVVMAQ